MTPNALTIFRLLLTPLILFLTYDATGPWRLTAALALFLLALLTDWLDGHLARSRGQITAFGTVMDPVADKALMLGLMFVLAKLGVVQVWVVLVVLFRELLVSGVRQYKGALGDLVGANWMGKTKFCMQAGVILLAYVDMIVRALGRELAGGVNVVHLAAALMAIASLAFALNFVRIQFFAHARRDEEPPPE